MRLFLDRKSDHFVIGCAGAVLDNGENVEARCTQRPYGRKVAALVGEVTAMKRLVQDGTDIDAVVLAGGGAFFFGEAIGRAYPKHSVITLKDAFFANCRGFQLAGLAHVEKERRRALVARASAT
jgi:hypothetical protein